MAAAKALPVAVTLAAKSPSKLFPYYSSLPLKPLSCAASADTSFPDSGGADTVAELLSSPPSRVERMMKMRRRTSSVNGGRWFPYLDAFSSQGLELRSGDVVAALDPYISEERKARMRRAVAGRSYAVCLVVEGLVDFGNVSAAFRSADALGVQSVHVVSSIGGRKRYRDNRQVSRGAEKWLDIELWNSPVDCFTALRKRGYRIATAHVEESSASIHELDWTCPTAIVVGNEHFGISKEALDLSDSHCSIPMNGMVDSFNVSVAAGIIMHHAVRDRVSRLGHHGDLTPVESQILLAEFFLRHKQSTISIINEYTRRKMNKEIAKQ